MLCPDNEFRDVGQRQFVQLGRMDPFFEGLNRVYRLDGRRALEADVIRRRRDKVRKPFRSAKIQDAPELVETDPIRNIVKHQNLK